MSDRPEALRLADVLDADLPYDVAGVSAELRRQHDKIERLVAERDALRAALQRLIEIEDGPGMGVIGWLADQQQAEPVGMNGLTEAETNATASVFGLTQQQAEPVQRNEGERGR